MAAPRPAKRRRAGSPGGRSSAPGRARVVVKGEERRRLIDDIAYFHAERFRPVEGQGIREEDRREAAAEIEAVLRRRRKR